MRPLEFKLECQVITPGKLMLTKELVDFGVFRGAQNDHINIRLGDGPEIIIDKDIAKAILGKIAEFERSKVITMMEKRIDAYPEINTNDKSDITI